MNWKYSLGLIFISAFISLAFIPPWKRADNIDVIDTRINNNVPDSGSYDSGLGPDTGPDAGFIATNDYYLKTTSSNYFTHDANVSSTSWTFSAWFNKPPSGQFIIEAGNNRGSILLVLLLLIIILEPVLDELVVL
ncbi:MAG: hypothetical protein HC877_18985 [Thioploca sp.]|nr:hypothetical protein [Thioploca sp.]